MYIELSFIFQEGFGHTFGVLLTPFVDYFCSDQSTVSWVGSLFSGLMSMFAPIVGGLVNKFGLRRICISGSIIACIGLLLSTLSRGVPILILTIGVIGGLGAGAINLPANIAVGYYFETKRALATGFSQCGSCVGQIVFATLASEVLRKKEWSWFDGDAIDAWKIYIFIIAGLFLLCSFFGALVLELKEEEIVDENGKKTIIATTSSLLPPM